MLSLCFSCVCGGVRCVCGGVFRRGGDKSLGAGATFLEILLNPYIPPLCFGSISGSISTLFLLPNLKRLEDFLLDC
jgi:hypothetical protein